MEKAKKFRKPPPPTDEEKLMLLKSGSVILPFTSNYKEITEFTAQVKFFGFPGVVCRPGLVRAN